MISLKFGLPLLRCNQGKAIAFDVDWLRTALVQAALHAGYHGWWQADDVAVGITSYLRHDYEGTVIDLLSLERAVRTVLCEVGYEEVAARFYTSALYPRVSLLQCVREGPRNNQTAFFDGLALQITRLHEMQSLQVHFCDLHACVRELKQLDPLGRDSGDQRLLQNVIVFIQERVTSLPWGRAMFCSIS